MQFEKCMDEYTEGNDIDDEQREIISSINDFIYNDQDEQDSGQYFLLKKLSGVKIGCF